MSHCKESSKEHIGEAEEEKMLGGPGSDRADSWLGRATEISGETVSISVERVAADKHCNSHEDER